MPRTVEGPPKQTLKALRPVHKLIARLGALGMSVKDIAAEVGMVKEHVSTLMHDALVRDYMLKLCDGMDKGAVATGKSVTDKIEAEADDSLKALIALRDSGGEQVSLRASMTLLDRAGYTSKDQLKLDTTMLVDGGFAEFLSNLRAERENVGTADPEPA